MSATKNELGCSKLDDHELIALARQYMFHPSGAPLTLDQVARKLDIAPRQLTLAFQRSLGLSMAAYARRERVRIAQRLLLQTSLSVQVIADQLGFSSAANFSSAFREQTDTSPSDFRKKAPMDQILMSDSDVKWG